MALPKLYEQITWVNDTTPALNEDNLNAMSQALDDIDDRVIDLAGTIMEDVPQIQEAIAFITPALETIDDSVTAAQNAATQAEGSASDASGYATAASGSATQAEGYAEAANRSEGNCSRNSAASLAYAQVSEGHAVGKKDGQDVPSTSPFYHNNAKYYSESAATSANSAASSASQAAAWSANPPYIGANGNWYVYDIQTSAYVDSGIDASITVTVGSTTTLTPGSSATVTNSGTSTDPILDFGIPQGAKGDTGNTGATPDITITATADATSSATPTVEVTEGGTAAAPTFALAFSGLKGAKGDTGATGATGATPQVGATATVDSNVGTPSVTVTKSGTDLQPSFAFAFSNIKGETGQTGATGATGATGPAGDDGADGYSPEVTITAITGGHTVTITDADHPSGQTFNVMDGTGAGDMVSSVYDPNGDVATAGGIVEYIDDVITDALTASY